MIINFNICGWGYGTALSPAYFLFSDYLCNILSQFIMMLYSGLDSGLNSGCVVGQLLHFVIDYL